MSKQLGFGVEFDNLFANQGLLDPHELYRRAREEAPIFWSEATNAWVLTRYGDVKRILDDEDTFAVLSGEAGASIHGRTILQMRGNEHRRKNSIIARGIRNPRLLSGPIAEQIQAISNDLIDELRTGAEIVDLKSAYTTPMPLAVITWMLDVEAAAEFREWYDALAAAGVENVVANPELRDAGLKARDELHRLVTPLIEQRRRNPGHDLISTLCAAEFEGERMSDEEIRVMVGFLLTAGVETTDRALCSLFRQAVVDPDLWTALREGTDSTWVGASVEILRLEPPVQALPRITIEDAQIMGHQLKAGTRVIGVIASANRDETQFDDVDRFDLNRFEQPDREFTAAASTLPFGAGSHLCTGSLLAKLEMVTAVRDLSTNFRSLELAADTPPLSVGVMLRSPRELPVRLTP